MRCGVEMKFIVMYSKESENPNEHEAKQHL